MVEKESNKTIINNLLKNITDPSTHFTGKTSVPGKSRVPTHLYHYTNADALQKILIGKTLRLSDIRYLNDEAEYRHIFDFTIEYLEQAGYGAQEAANSTRTHVADCIRSDLGIDFRRARDILTNEIEDEELSDQEKEVKPKLPEYFEFLRKQDEDASFCFYLQRVVEDYRDNNLHTAPPCYVCSLSEEHDSLSQWRGYCPNGGYSLGFDAIKLGNSVSDEFLLGRCHYFHEEKRKILQQILQMFRSSFGDFIANGLDLSEQQPGHRTFANINNLPNDEWNLREEELNTQHNQWKCNIGRTLSRFAPFFKHKGFHKEKEWRFVNGSSIFPDAYDESETKFRTREPTFIPFTEMKLHGFLETIKANDIKVVVGPMSNQELAKDAVIDFLRAILGERAVTISGYLDTVEKSVIPYRTS